MTFIPTNRIFSEHVNWVAFAKKHSVVSVMVGKSTYQHRTVPYDGLGISCNVDKSCFETDSLCQREH